MCNGEKSPQQNADTTNDDIRNPHERVLSTHDSSRRDEDGFRSSILCDGKICNTTKSVNIQNSDQKVSMPYEVQCPIDRCPLPLK